MAKEINFIRPQEVYEDGKSVVRYRSYDGKDKYVQASDSPEGGGGGADAPLVLKITITDRGERIPNKSSQEVLDAIREGKGVIYSISNGGSSNYCTSLVYCDGFFGEQNVPIIQVSYLDFTDGTEYIWGSFSHVGNEIRDLITS